MTGFVMLPKFILQNTALTPCSIVLYANLLHFDRKNGNGCYCKKETLARFCNMSLFQVRASLKILEAEGIISILKRYNGLTDVIKINPDCRPQQKSKRVKQSSQSLGLRNPSASSIIKNNTTQVNNIRRTETPEGVVKQQPKKDTIEGISPAQPPTTITPNLKYAPLTKTILDQIRPQIRPQSFSTWFADVFVEKETDTEVEIFTPGGVQVAGWLKEHYLSLLEGVAGKQVKILSQEETT